MKQIILFFLISLISLNVLALRQVKTPESVNVHLKFHYEDGLKRKNASNTVLRMSANNTYEWRSIAGMRSCDSIDRSNIASDFLLFAKVENIARDTATIKLMIIDSKAGLGYIREPMLIAKYGQKSHLKLVDGDRRLDVELLVNRDA